MSGLRRVCSTHPEEKKTTKVTLAGPVQYARSYYHCQACHRGFCPTDQELGFAGEHYSPAVRETLALLAQTAPFETASDLLERLTGLAVSAKTMQRESEAIGAAWLAQEQAEAAALDQAPFPEPPPGPAPETLVVSLDGGMIHTKSGGWKELKVGTVYDLKDREKRGKRGILGTKGLVSWLGAIGQFGPLLYWLCWRWRAFQAHNVLVIADGAAWIWNWVDEYLPQSHQLLDWYHAVEHLWDVAKVRWPEAKELQAAWVKPLEALLWNGRVDEVLATLGKLEWSGEAGKAVQALIGYYTTHSHRMDYAGFRARGWPIGSGVVESTHRGVIQGRLKLSGMRWSEPGANAIAHLRTVYFSGQWDAHWPHLAKAA